MEYTKWTNYTEKHPKGVCEAATSVWLEKIAESGIAKACNLTPDDCDALQSEVEKGGYTWATGLLPRLRKWKTDTDFDPFTGPTFKAKNVVKEDILQTLKSMKMSDFLFISATTSTGNGHALAVYKEDEEDKLYFFDPNKGIYIGSAKEIAEQLKENTNAWVDVVGRYGKL